MVKHYSSKAGGTQMQNTCICGAQHEICVNPWLNDTARKLTSSDEASSSMDINFVQKTLQDIKSLLKNHVSLTKLRKQISNYLINYTQNMTE